MAETLYGDPTLTRFFLVPDGANLPAGNLLLRSPTGARIEVDPDVVALFEVPDDEAKEHARRTFDRALARARTFLEAHGAGAQDPVAALEGLRSAGAELLDRLAVALASEEPVADPALEAVRGPVRDLLQTPGLAERIRAAAKDIRRAAEESRKEREKPR